MRGQQHEYFKGDFDAWYVLYGAREDRPQGTKDVVAADLLNDSDIARLNSLSF